MRLRLIRIRARRRENDVWLLSNVEPGRLSRALAGQMYRWRWENEGCFRTYKRTLDKVKLVSRTVKLVHREAEGSWLALQLLMAQATMSQLPRAGAGSVDLAVVIACSPRQVLVAIRQEMQGLANRARLGYWQRLQRSRRENRQRQSDKEKRVWPRRKPHRTPKPPKILKLTEAKKAIIATMKCSAA